MGRLPTEAFEHYVGLGPDRSYEAVAQKYGVSKRSVTKRAGQEGWQERLARIEQEARDRTDARLIESIDSMNSRHLKMVQALQGKALEALRNAGPLNGAAAARALDAAIARERAIRGTPDTRPGKVAMDAGTTVIHIVTGVPARDPLPDPPVLPALPAPRDGHDVRRPGVN